MTLTDIGTITDNLVETFSNQTVTTAEPNDIFKFEINEDRSVNLLLTDLSGDADLALYRDSNDDGRLQTCDYSHIKSEIMMWASQVHK